MSDAAVGPVAGESATREFPCTHCGAKLAFAPGTNKLKCPYCGTENAIALAGGTVGDADYEATLARLESEAPTHEEERVRCSKCGADQTLGEGVFAGACAFCGAPIVEAGYAHRQVKPAGILPFAVEKARAQESFRDWLKHRWLAPSDLRRYAQTDAALTGAYLPFWCYDCRTATDYTGERGDDYETTENVTTRNASGETVTEARRVRHTRWTPASGHVGHFHKDVLVFAAAAMPRLALGPLVLHYDLGALGRWNLAALVPYQPEFVSGFQAQAYRVGLREAFVLAKEQIDATVESLVRQDIGGDHQRIASLATRYADIGFRHLLLPVWTTAYRYRDRVYHITVNGQTGEVSGESPKSWWKIALLVLAVIAAIVAIQVLGTHK